MGWWERTFMIRSGRKVPTPAMPMPDFAVPYAAPAPVVGRGVSYCLVEVGGSREDGGRFVVLPKIMADAIPAWRGDVSQSVLRLSLVFGDGGLRGYSPFR